MAKGLAALAAAFALALTAFAGTAAAADPLDAAIERNLAFATAQLNRTLAEVPTGSYPHYTQSDGTWLERPAGWWISGFLPGSLWLMYQATGDPAWRNAAAARQAAIEPYKTSTSTHDLGFMIFDSFGQGFRQTGVDSYRQVAITASNSLATRFSPVVGAVRSWNNTSGDAATDFKVIVDNMMNLELLTWGGRSGAEPTNVDKAISHAQRSAAEHVRTDGSTHHLVVFDSNTGAVKRKQTVQGYSDTSTWARGQAWALYGFTMAYREVRVSSMLTTARRVADWYVAHLPADRVPYWDFQAPGIPNEPRDSSAAAIAASGLLELSQIETDPARAQQYLDVAKATLTSLSSPAYLAEGTNARSLLLHGTSNQPIGEYDHGLIYGDYYFLEAMLRYRAISRNALSTPEERAPDFNGDGYSDLVSGAPNEDDGSAADAGQVSVVYGTATGLDTRRNLQLTQRPNGVPESGDRFGAAVATGDFNHDGFSDLAIGAPGEGVGSSADAGQVSVLHGSSTGLPKSARHITQTDAAGTAESGDRFGAALTAGDFDGDGFADLAVGAPDEDGPLADAGHVNVLYGSNGGLSSSRAQAFSQGGAGGSNEGGDRFGAALAADRLDGDARADLVVGSPDEDVGSVADAGQVSVVYGTATGLSPTRNQQPTQSHAAGGVEPGDRFGAALAVGNFDGDAYRDVAIGAPDEDNNSLADAGHVSILHGGATAVGRPVSFSQGGSGGSNEAGDRFGASLAAGRIDDDAYAELIAGSPDEDAGSLADAGQISVLFGTASGPSASRNQQLTQSHIGAGAEPGDRFGSAVAVALLDRDGRGDVAVGAPNEDNGSVVDIGHVNVLYGTATGLSAARAQTYSQGGAGGVSEPGDRFGAALR